MMMILSHLKYIVSAYRRSFWRLVAVIIVFSICIFLVANFSGVPMRVAANIASVKSQDVSEYIYDAELNFHMCSQIIKTLAIRANVVDAEGIYNDAALDDFVRNLDIVVSEFIRSRDTIAGYFYKINSDKPDSRYEVFYDGQKEKIYHISVLADAASLSGADGVENQAATNPDPFWTSLYNYMTGQMYLSYVVPVYHHGNYLGFCGINIDLDYLKQQFFAGQETMLYGMLVTDDLQVIVHPYIDAGTHLSVSEPGLFQNLPLPSEGEGFSTKRDANGHAWLLTCTRLPSGQIYITAAQSAALMRQANVLIILTTLLAVLCIFLVQKNRRTDETLFDRLVEVYLHKSTMTQPLQNRHRAAFALYVGMTLSMFAYFLYGWLTLRAASGMPYLFLCVALVIIFTVYVRHLYNKRVAVLLAGLIMTLPLIAHLSMGGYAAAGWGLVLLWSSVSFVVVLFLFDAHVAEAVFSIYVIFLFLEMLVEIYIFKNADYYRIFMLISTLFFLGFAFFSAFGVFLTRSEKDYNDIGTLLARLKETQSLLVQKEKMTTLGTLIAGIAHEINTPVGAVKASAENLDASVQPLIETMLMYGHALDEEDFYALTLIMEASREALSEMKSTLETRRERNRLRALLREKEFTNADELTERLSRLEVTEWAASHQDILRRPHIEMILQVAEMIFPVVTATNTVVFATGRIERIVSALKAYVHTQGVFEPFDVVRSVENVLCLYDYQLRGAIQVVRQYEEDLPHVNGNMDELGQVWTNLIQNAIYAMRGTGTMTIRIYHDYPYVCVRVSDSGHGIDPGKLEMIFDPFYTTKPVGEGSGLGLDICRNIINRHKGEMYAENDSGGGAAFVVKLPLGTAEG